MSNFYSDFLVQIISVNNVIRSENLETILTDFGIEYKIPPEVIPDVGDFQAGLLHSASLTRLISQRTVRINEIGCALAHRVAMINFLKSDHKFGIFFEDDAEIITKFNFDALTQLLDSDIPIIVTLGWIPGFAISKNLQILPSEELIELITAPTCTFAYAMNRPAARLMIDSHEKIIDLPDWPIYTLNRVKFYAPRWPWVTANHDPKLSTIGVRSTPLSKSPFGILLSRIRLVTYLITLVLLCKINRLDASPKQILHQLLIRGSLHRYGVSQVVENLATSEVIPLPLKFQKILSLLKLN
jgi:hypothetical protein